MQQRRTREEVKESILAACVRLFLEQGYAKTTLAEISKGAGVSISSFQNIFVNKDLLNQGKRIFKIFSGINNMSK